MERESKVGGLWDEDYWDVWRRCHETPGGRSHQNTTHPGQHTHQQARWMAAGETAAHSNVPVIWEPRGACRRVLWRHSKQPTRDGCAQDMAATATAREKQSVLKRVRQGTDTWTQWNGKFKFVEYFNKWGVNNNDKLPYEDKLQKRISIGWLELWFFPPTALIYKRNELNNNTKQEVLQF